MLLQMDGSLAELMQEMGYGCCATVEECHKTLVQFGINGLTASNVAKVIGMMARTHSGLMDNLPLQVRLKPPIPNTLRLVLAESQKLNLAKH